MDSPIFCKKSPAMFSNSGSEGRSTGVTVGGIMTNGNQKVALINDKVYAEGDKINGMKILNISFDQVVVSDQGQEKMIKVKGK